MNADIVAKVFNQAKINNWRARAYLKGRTNGVFNAVSFSYKGGMVQLLMDCDKPLGSGFQIKFQQYTGSFGDYVAAIQKALYKVLTTLRDSEVKTEVPEDLSLNDIAFALRKDGAITYLRLTDPNPPMFGDELTYTDEEDQRPEHELLDVDELL